MSEQGKAVLASLMSLPVEMRAEIAEGLLASLEGPEPSLEEQAAIDASWAAEADRRFQAYKRGEIKAVPIEEVLDMLRDRAQERAKEKRYSNER